MGFLTIQEKPPLREVIIARTPSGQTFRWGEDAWDAADRPDDTSHSSSAPGGYASFNGSLPRVYENQYADLPPLTEITVLDGAGSTVGEFYLERAPRRSGDITSIGVEAVGFQNLLADEKNVNWLGIDPLLEGWHPAYADRKDQLSTVVSTIDTAIQPTTDGGIGFLSESGATVPAFSYAALDWDASPGAFVKKVIYSGTQSNTTNIDAPQIVGTDNSRRWLNPVTLALTLDGSRREVTFTTPKQYLEIVGRANAAVTPGAGAGFKRLFTVMALVGDHGLSVYSGTAGPGLLASDVITYLVKQFAPGLTLLGSNVKATDLVIPSSRGDQTNLPDLIAEHNKYHMWDWAVWEGKQFYYDRPGEAAVHKTWRARVGPSQLEETGRDVRRICNGTYVKYTDVQGKTRIVGPPSTRADYQTAALLDLDPANEANQAGRKLYDLVEMRGVSEQAPAIAVGQAYMALRKSADRSGSATVAGYVQTDAGHWFPHTSIRGGDRIQFVDSSDPSPRQISDVSHNRSRRESQITLDAPPQTLDAILDRLSLSLQGTGLS